MNEQLLTKEELAVRLNISAYDIDQLRKKEGKGKMSQKLQNFTNIIKNEKN